MFVRAFVGGLAGSLGHRRVSACAWEELRCCYSGAGRSSSLIVLSIGGDLLSVIVARSFKKDICSYGWLSSIIHMLSALAR